jgi:SAM-dependent methyltransferase
MQQYIGQVKLSGLAAPARSVEISSTVPNTSIKNSILGRRTTTPYTTLAPLYDRLLGNRFFLQLRHAFERLVQRYGIHFASAADVACGTGTFVRYLCQCGTLVVYGVDRSPEMLRTAIGKNQTTGARFLLQDFGTLALPQPVDLITCCFYSLNYLLTTAELQRALARFYTNLNPGGYAIFDMVTDRPGWQGSEPLVEPMVAPGAPVALVSHWDPQRHIQTIHVSILQNGRAHQEIHRQRGYPVAVVAQLLTRARFALVGFHDFQTLGPATLRTSQAVYVARKLRGETHPWPIWQN